MSALRAIVSRLLELESDLSSVGLAILEETKFSVAEEAFLFLSLFYLIHFVF